MSKEKPKKIKTNTFSIPAPKPRNPFVELAARKNAGTHKNKDFLSRSKIKSNIKLGRFD